MRFHISALVAICASALYLPNLEHRQLLKPVIAHRGYPVMKILILMIGVIFVGCFSVPNRAQAQHYEGCFVNGQQVPDSECQSGGGSSSYSGGCNVLCQGLRDLIWGTPGPSAAQIARSRANSLHDQGTQFYHQGNYEKALDLYRQAMEADPDFSPAAGDYWALKAIIDRNTGNLDLALREVKRAAPFAEANYTGYRDIQKTIEEAISARDASAMRQFAKDQQDLLSQIHSMDDASASLQLNSNDEQQPMDHGALRVYHADELNPRQITPPTLKEKDGLGPAMLRVINQTTSYVTVSVDGSYGCNTAGATTCVIPVSRGSHNLRAVRTDTGVAFSELVDVPANGYTWPLSGN